MRWLLLVVLLGAAGVYALGPGSLATMGAEVTVEPTAADDADHVALDVGEPRLCGPRCGAADLTLTNTRSTLAQNVSVRAAVFAGQTAEGVPLWTRTDLVGDLEPGETRTLTHRAGWDDGTVTRVRTAGGWVTVEITVGSDETTTTFVGTHQLG